MRAGAYEMWTIGWGEDSQTGHLRLPRDCGTAGAWTEGVRWVQEQKDLAPMAEIGIHV